MLPMQVIFQLVKGFKQYELKTRFSKWAHPGSPMLYKNKSCQKRYILVLYRWKMAENGGNGLKLAKSEWFGTKKLRKTNNAAGLIDWLLQYLRTFLHAMTQWSRGSVLDSRPEIWSSNSLFSKIFLFFIWAMGVMGSNPDWICTIFSYVELNFLCHLWLLDIISNMNQTEQAPDNLTW